MSCRSERRQSEQNDALVGVSILFFLVGWKVGWKMGRRDLLQSTNRAMRIIEQMKEK